ncbi:hypothetical protein [Cellulomonas fimi]|uniref:AbiEi antitoxin C-terminal domain-containing protein n=1 Tax=Cellulomonas fimi TaxID=1708 RepID=A0A7Y0LYD0_CELFI|nr:hypothetical protein [Cellulomonas fimi]NMR20134.1 hypothetical protein [Cellulomonas fimi]
MEVSTLARLWPAMPVAPDWLHTSDVGAVPWQVLVRESVMLRVWDEVAVAADRDETPGLRAASVLPLVPRRGVVGRAAAVWVHAGGPPPARVDVLVPPRTRRPSPHPLRVPHECALADGDVVELGPVRVTTVARTAVDVARWSSRDVSARLLERLATHAGLDARGAVRLLDDLPGHRGTQAAREALLDVAARVADQADGEALA